jgi:RHS repeat-associated protein
MAADDGLRLPVELMQCDDAQGHHADQFNDGTWWRSKVGATNGSLTLMGRWIMGVLTNGTNDGKCMAQVDRRGESPVETIPKLVTGAGTFSDAVFGETFGPFRMWAYSGTNLYPDPVRPQGPEAKRGDPFNAIGGGQTRDETDLDYEAPGVPLRVGRAYNSGEAGGAEFGPGWRASFDWGLDPPTGITGRVRTPEGRVFTFAPDGDTWITPCDVRWRLRAAQPDGWTIEPRDSSGYIRFDSQCRWLSTEDGWGNSIAGLRDTQGRVTNLAHSCGLSIGVDWNGNRVSSLAGPSGIGVDYAYDQSGVLTGVVRHAGAESPACRRYAYEGTNGVMTNAWNALGDSFWTRHEIRNGTRRVVGSGFGNGAFTSLATWRLTNWLTRIEYPVATNRSRWESVRWIPTAQRMSWVEKAGERMDYYYDPASLVATGLLWRTSNQTANARNTLDSQGRPVRSAFCLNGGQTPDWRTEWTGDLDLPAAQIDPLGWRTEYAWTNGLLAAVRQTNAAGWLASSLIYSQGMPVAVIDPRGQTTRLSYDGAGGLTRLEPPAGPVTVCSNDALGRVLAASLPAATGTRTWTYERDGFGRVTRAIDPDGLSTRYAYDPLGRATSVVDRAGRTVALSYGIAGRLLSATRTLAEAGSNATVAIGRDLQMDPLTVRDPLGRTVEAYVRDEAGRVATVTNIEGRTAATTYGILGLPQAIDRFDGTRVGLTYDGAGRLCTVAYPGRTNTFPWLANGLPAAVSDGTVTLTNTWHAPGWLAVQRTVAPGWTGTVEYARDAAGSVTQAVAAAANTAMGIGRDAAGREIDRVQRLGNASVTATREYGSWNGLPVRVTIDNGVLEQQLDWDNLDRLTGMVWRANGQNVRTISYRHDVLGQITQRTDRVGSAATVRGYTCDGLDRLAGETHSSGFAATYSFDDAGRRTAKSTVPFDVTYTPGEGDRLERWTVTRTNLDPIAVTGYSTETPATNPTYRFVEVRNGLLAVTPVISGTNFTATVPAGALGTQTVAAAISDAAGNVGLATNVFLLTAYTTGEYTGDAAGCVTQIVYRGPGCEASRTLTWDSEYRLVGVSTNGVPAESYTYDPLGRRIATTAGDGTVTRHLWDGPHVLADLDATGGVLRTYVYGPGIDELLAVVVTKNEEPGTTNTYYAIRDHQNTVWAWTDESGSVVESYDYDPWGRVLAVRDGDGTELARSAIGNRFLFQGREYSWATGLYCFRARWYDPVTGRFISKDPSGIANGLNEYVALNNSPVNFVDPTGEAAIEAHQYWMDVASGGFDTARGGGCWGTVGGYGQAAGASIMTAFIDFWGARDIEGSAGLSGYYSGSDECQGKAWKYGLFAAGMIGINAIPGGEGTSKVFSKDAQALLELANQARRTGVTAREAETLLEWAREYGVQGLQHTSPADAAHWVGGPHIRIGPVNHIPVRP